MHRLYDAGIIMLFVVLFVNPFYGGKGTKMFFVLRFLLSTRPRAAARIRI